MKYLVSLTGQDGNIFDEDHFEDTKQGKEWAKGRNQYYDTKDNRFKRYAVRVYVYENDIPMLVEEYSES